MNKFELNREEELINRLLDRDIAGSERSQILDELSQFPDYKNTLADYEEIQSVIKNDKTVLIPPKEFDKAVFAQVDKLSEVLVHKSFLVRNRYTLIGLLLLFVGFTGYFGQDLFKGKQAQSNAVSKAKMANGEHTAKQSGTIAENNQIAEKSVPVVSNSEVNETKTGTTNNVSVNSKKQINSSIKHRTDTKTQGYQIDANTQVFGADKKTLAELKKQKSVFNSPAEFDESTKITLEEKNIIDPRFNLVVVNSNFDNFRQNQITPFAIGQNKYTRALLNNLTKTNWLLQYRGLYAVSNPEKGLQGRNFYFNSYCFGGFVEAFDGIYLGAEFGAEPYSQIYLDQNTSAQFEQTPNIFYFGVAGKFALKNTKFLGIYPCAQLFIGSSSLGPLVRSNLTLQYDLFGNIGFFVGAEGGEVFYSNNGVWYNSGKLGLIGGLNIKL